ncbi:nuclear GTPase SLIP-GC-like isoform X2 [Oreochromis aureus]|uniref:Dynamin N-terminal domain-containing protein n=1 Tax=Oreochromis aureus TaxID=47969 RepID=A0AAZ1XST2_OREAU|nr:nuclear GTPase SLIP-GC-like isoform X2 [Oreochromis aureus]
MDDFVREKLIEWDLQKWMDKFEDEEITQESFYELNDELIDKLIPKVGPGLKFKKRFKQLKEKQSANEETVNLSAEVLPSTSDKGKRRFDQPDESSKLQPPAKRQRSSQPLEAIVLSDVKNIMKFVHARLHEKDKLSAFLKKKISDLETDKRELVGVFGKTGAGKSSLINAIIEEKNLLPSGSVSACTSVMIKVEANMQGSNYEADIEFITPEEWKDELWSSHQFLGDNKDCEMDVDNDYRDISEKFSALYGEEWKGKSSDDLMDGKYFREIPEFLQGRRKILTCESAKELSARCVKYTRSDSKQGDGKDVKKWYWPLVKCVTVRVPNNDFLQHVTLVDLPGNGDRNKSRDKMWKQIVENCSTVWIVTEINRVIAEKEAWEILESASSYIGNGGECRQILFICTKSDHIEDSDDQSAAQRRDLIVKRNIQVKDEVRKEFSKLHKIKKHFTDDHFKVFTVSSKEFLKKKRLNADETEIPKLQQFLQDLNDCHSETFNYVSGAYGILSLIQGANCRGVRKKGSAFHMTLKRVVQSGGIYKPKKGKQININMMLASHLMDSIDEEFRKTFPNEVKCGAFNGVIETFSLNTDFLNKHHKDVELQLRFLKTEEEKIKAKLNKTIRTQKKDVYNSVTQKIKETMEECYIKAAAFRGPGTLNNMRETIERHVHSNKGMFEQAKNTMLEKLNALMQCILVTLQKTMMESIELSLKTDNGSLPDFSAELSMVKENYDKLANSPVIR